MRSGRVPSNSMFTSLLDAILQTARLASSPTNSRPLPSGIELAKRAVVFCRNK